MDINFLHAEPMGLPTKGRDALQVQVKGQGRQAGSSQARWRSGTSELGDIRDPSSPQTQRHPIRPVPAQAPALTYNTHLLPRALPQAASPGAKSLKHHKNVSH